ncbi:MAG: hypothetical protein IPO21_10925 [Bacteroidales bacterium]|nr:hypothetical protein [Bacteroidales bacterium]
MTVSQAVQHVYTTPEATKKISVENNIVTQGSFTEKTYIANNHWLVSKWDIGTTENGSSGGGLFRNDNHLLIGTLTGGEATCTKPINDYFAQFYKYWNAYPDSTMQLKHWLSPETDYEQCMGLNALYYYHQFVTNIKPDEPVETAWFVNSNISSPLKQNTIPCDGFAERFTGLGNQKIYALSFPFYISDTILLNNITINIWNGFNEPDSLLWSQSLNSKKIVNYIYDGLWMYIVLDEPIEISGSVFVGFEYNQLLSDFSVYSTNKDVIALSTLYYKHSNIWKNISELARYGSMALEILIAPPTDSTISKTFQNPSYLEQITYKEINNTSHKLYPNPASKYLFILFPETIPYPENFDIEICNYLGQIVSKALFKTINLGYFQ